MTEITYRSAIDQETVGKLGESPFSEVVRSWPVVLAIALVTVGASLLATASREPSYSATAQLLITPLPQWDETFLGTSLIRDSGDANRTAASVAEFVDSDEVARDASAALGGDASEESVRDAVEVKPVAETNVVAVTAVAGNPQRAVELADAFAGSVLTVRWRTIEKELDDRIGLMADTLAPVFRGEEAARVSGTLRMIRSTDRDPTMTLRKSSPAVRVEELPRPVILGLALVGGLFLGGLVALGMGRTLERPT